jgi:hypothetical protein
MLSEITPLNAEVEMILVEKGFVEGRLFNDCQIVVLSFEIDQMS